MEFSRLVNTIFDTIWDNKQPTTVKNPQSNAVCKRMHKIVADILYEIH